MKGRLKTTKEV